MAHDPAKLRKAHKAKMPRKFIRQDSPKHKKLDVKWRRPNGLHSALRRQFRGKRALVEPGYKSPRIIRDCTPDGKLIVHVANMAQLNTIDPKKQSVVIASSIGFKYRKAMLEAVAKKGISCLNIKDGAAYIKKQESERAASKKIQKETETKKAGKKQQADSKKESKSTKTEKKDNTENVHQHDQSKQAKKETPLPKGETKTHQPEQHKPTQSQAPRKEVQK